LPGEHIAPNSNDNYLWGELTRARFVGALFPRLGNKRKTVIMSALDDLLKTFGTSSGGMTEQIAAQLHDRFVSNRPEDSQFDNATYHQAATEYVGKMPDDQFHAAAQNAMSSVPPQQRQDLLGGLLNALQGAGGAGGLAGIASMLGLSSTDPSQMTHDDATKVMNYARKENPDALQQTVQEKPWFLKALGNPIVMGALTVAATKLLSSQRNKV
jgi:hypothetical protein